MTTMLEKPGSPARRRSMKGESIRSLRELLQASLSSSSLPEENHEVIPTEDQDKKETSKDDIVATNVVAAAAATTTSATPAATTGRDANQVRSRLLENLGIQKESDKVSSAPPPTSLNSSSAEPWGPTTEEALKENTTQPAPTIKLRFDPIVQVHPIPSYKVYSDRIRQTIWTNAYELQEQVARNSLEFSYEHWDANRVLDEDNGLIYHKGEWIHPVHVEFEVPEGEPPLSSEEELWILSCERLGIQPASFYHSLPTTTRKK